MTKIILPPRMSPVGYHIDEAYMVPDPEGEYYDREALLDILKAAGVEVEEKPMITAGSRVTRKSNNPTPMWREACEAAGVDVHGVFAVSRVDYDCDDAKLWLSGVVNIAFKIDQGFYLRNFKLVE